MLEQYQYLVYKVQNRVSKIWTDALVQDLEGIYFPSIVLIAVKLPHCPT